MNNNPNKTKLTFAETVIITSMLFGIFSGAGMGRIVPAIVGLVIGLILRAVKK